MRPDAGSVLSGYARRARREIARKAKAAAQEAIRRGMLAPQPMTPAQVADLVQRARAAEPNHETAHPARWERYRVEQWRPQIKLADVEAMQRRAGVSDTAVRDSRGGR